MGVTAPFLAQHLHDVRRRPVGRAFGRPGDVDSRQFTLADHPNQLPGADAPDQLAFEIDRGVSRGMFGGERSLDGSHSWCTSLRTIWVTCADQQRELSLA